MQSCESVKALPEELVLNAHLFVENTKQLYLLTLITERAQGTVNRSFGCNCLWSGYWFLRHNPSDF
jgi:hypothetical protein